MNAQLAGLIDQGVTRLADRAPRRWCRLVMMNSVGPVPLSDDARAAWHGDRGFNLLLVDAAGRTAFFCKCRDASDAAFARETEVLERLGEAEGARAALPAACGISDGRIRIQMSAYVRGQVLRHLIPRMGTAEWEAALTGVIGAADAVSEAAPAALVGRLDVRATVDVADAGATALATLAGAGLDADALAVLRGVLAAAGELAWRPQHGDLWSSNVLRDDGRWLLLDFEQFGLVGTPLYDVAHLVRTTAQARATPSQAWDAPPPLWTPLLRGGSPDAAVCRRVLGTAARHRGLGAAAALGAVVYYLTDYAARLLANGAPPALAAPTTREVAAFADVLRERGTADHLLGFA